MCTSCCLRRLTAKAVSSVQAEVPQEPRRRNPHLLLCRNRSGPPAPDVTRQLKHTLARQVRGTDNRIFGDRQNWILVNVRSASSGKPRTDLCACAGCKAGRRPVRILTDMAARPQRGRWRAEHCADLDLRRADDRTTVAIRLDVSFLASDLYDVLPTESENQFVIPTSREFASW